MNMRAYLSEFTGTTILLATVIGSGIMGETLANGNAAIALLGNTIATGYFICFNNNFWTNFGSSFQPNCYRSYVNSKKNYR